MTRLLTAAVLAPLLWLLIKRASPALFYGAALCTIVGASWECYRMLRQRGGRPLVVLGLAATAAVVASHAPAAAPVGPTEVLVAAALVVVAAAMALRATPERMLDTIVETLLPVVLLGLTMGYVLALRGLPEADGSDLVLLLFICVIFGDTAALYVGTAFGRRRMAPKISPHKSWAGLVGALGGGVVGALVAHGWFYQRLPLGHAVALGVILAGAGALGDLSESMVKRACGVKDSSSLFPGHGGLFDRTDSLIFAAPVLYHYHAWFLRGGM